MLSVELLTQFLDFGSPLAFLIVFPEAAFERNSFGPADLVYGIELLKHLYNLLVLRRGEGIHD